MAKPPRAKPGPKLGQRRSRGPYWTAMETFERGLLLDYLAQFNESMPDVAGALGVALQTLYYRCKKLKIGRYAAGRKPT